LFGTQALVDLSNFVQIDLPEKEHAIPINFEKKGNSAQNVFSCSWSFIEYLILLNNQLKKSEMKLGRVR